MHQFRSSTSSAQPSTTRGAATAVLIAATTAGAALGTISVLMRDHRRTLAAEPPGEGPGPKQP